MGKSQPKCTIYTNSEFPYSRLIYVRARLVPECVLSCCCDWSLRFFHFVDQAKVESQPPHRYIRSGQSEGFILRASARGQYGWAAAKAPVSGSSHHWPMTYSCTTTAATTNTCPFWKATAVGLDNALGGLVSTSQWQLLLGATVAQKKWIGVIIISCSKPLPPITLLLALSLWGLIVVVVVV